MRKALIITFLTGFIILGIEVGFSLEYDDIQVLKSDGQGIIFRYKPSNLLQDEMIIDNQVFHQVQVGKCPLTQTPGEPQLPMRIVILGIPLGSEVVATIIDSDYSELNGFNITPVPAYHKSEDPLENEALYKKDENIYSH